MPGTSTVRPVAKSQTDQSGYRNQEAGSEVPKVSDGWWKRRVPWPAVGLVALATGTLGTMAGMAWFSLGPLTHADIASTRPSPELVAALTQQVEMLCKLPRQDQWSAIPGDNDTEETPKPIESLYRKDESLR